ncbi:MAG: type II toxin-antitoxin system PemK/MazF family toxin [Candidatus Rokubacteria bacterium]|nr:type II toxin-antitoxin system PemK/MazF family toxin [Candidatus Rokubacteria bacterium]
MRRGEVWWAELPPPFGRRPVVLLSRDEAYAIRNQLTVAPVTTRIRGIRSEVPLGPEQGLPKRCVANLDTMGTIPKVALRERIALLPREKVQAINTAIRFALALE